MLGGNDEMKGDTLRKIGTQSRGSSDFSTKRLVSNVIVVQHLWTNNKTLA